MKTISALLLSFMFTLNSIAQISAAEAKAAYLLAEESFAASDWKGALSYLGESRKKIGKPNSKILYLQLMTELELAKTDTSYYREAVKTIADFEKAPDVKEFNEDKMMEVMKAKLRLNRLLEAREKERIAKEERAAWMMTLGGVVVAEKDRHGFVMANEDIGKMNHADAKQACDDLELNGYSDWRLATADELSKIISIDSQLRTLSLPVGYIPLKGMYWSNSADKKTAKKLNQVRPVRSF